MQKKETEKEKFISYLEQADKYPLSSLKRAAYIDSALAIHPQSAVLWQQRAMPLFKQKKYELGMTFLDSAVKYDEKGYIGYRAFIKCIFQKSYAASIIDFERAKQLIGFSFEMDHSYDFYLGLCYLQLNQFAKAETFINSSLKYSIENLGSKQGNFLELFYLGVINSEMENYITAIDYFDKSLLIYSNFSDALYYKAICLENLNKFSDALSCLQESNNYFLKGYTINEGNSIYETYPYQVTPKKLEGYLERLKTISK